MRDHRKTTEGTYDAPLSLVLEKPKMHEEGLRLFDATCRGDRAEADQGDVAQQSLFHGERHEHPFEFAL
jgi:hypothetical protein